VASQVLVNRFKQTEYLGADNYMVNRNETMVERKWQLLVCAEDSIVIPQEDNSLAVLRDNAQAQFPYRG
jgi:hypothetical protein